MKATLFIMGLISLNLSGQTRTISGRVISEELETLTGVVIFNRDGVPIGGTDIDGRFELEIPQGTDQLRISGLGLEPATITLQKDCDRIEIVMLLASTYDFMSSGKTDKLRLKQFETINKLHRSAFEKGLFTDSMPCYFRDFEPIKQELDEIHRQTVLRRKQVKETYGNISVGDTVRIPFGTEWRYDGTDRTSLFVYSSYTSAEEFDCVITGVVLGKNRRKRGYNLVYKVTGREDCDQGPLLFGGKKMLPGEVFEHDMKYFKVLDISAGVLQ